ncbi:MAG: polysaccharide biosynthesis C-terminal domain-containing protein [Polyangiaceae bacterium]|nr:polysaccharide biosynthesis C-terminal domain-containing protein [Polyangiaceae bacterium]
MLTRLRSWVQRKDASFLFFFGGRLLAGILAILTVKYVIAFLSREQYGEWGFLGVVAAVLVPIVSLQLPNAMMRMYFDHADDAVAERRALVTSVGLSSAAGALLVALGALALWLAGVQSFVVTLYLVAVVTARVGLNYFSYLTLARNDYGLFFFSKVFEAGTYLGLVTWAVFASRGGQEGEDPTGRLVWLTGALAITLWLLVAVNVVFYARAGLLRVSARIRSFGGYRALLSYSLPLVPSFFFGWVLASSDVWVLRRLSSLVETADYVLALELVSVVALVQQSALQDWPRFYYAKMRDGGESRDSLIARRVRLFLTIHVATIVVVRLIAAFAYDLLGATAYSAGLQYLGYLLLGNYWFLLGNVFAAGLGYAKRTRLILWAFALPGVANVLLNLWLIPLWGGRAAAITTAASYALFAALCFGFARKYYRFTELSKVAGLSLLATLAALL